MGINAKHIAIAGNMGVGKSTLTSILSEHLGAKSHFESVTENPYLELFYEDMQRWSFHSQFTFLSQAFKQHCDIIAEDTSCVQDRTIYEHFQVFATSHYEQGLMSENEYRTLEDHYRSLIRIVPSPDIMIFLRADTSTLLERIHSRDRSCESTISAEYLEGLEQRYDRWINSYDESDLLIIDTNEINIHDPQQKKQLLELLTTRIFASTETELMPSACA